jgi:hypothetical protein
MKRCPAERVNNKFMEDRTCPFLPLNLKDSGPGKDCPLERVKYKCMEDL